MNSWIRYPLVFLLGLTFLCYVTGGIVNAIHAHLGNVYMLVLGFLTPVWMPLLGLLTLSIMDKLDQQFQ